MNALKLNAHPNTPLLVSPPPPGTRIPEREREIDSKREPREAPTKRAKEFNSTEVVGFFKKQWRTTTPTTLTSPINRHFTTICPNPIVRTIPAIPSLFSPAPRISGIINPAFGSSWFSDYSYLIYCVSSQIQPKWLLMMLSIWRRRYSRALNSILKWYFR